MREPNNLPANGVTTPFRFGLIGAGRIAQTYLTACRQIPEIELAAVSDSAPGVAAAAAEAFGGRAYESYEALLAADRLDGVAICTPPVTHREIALACLQAGLHVLVEKPIALAADDVRTMLAESAARQRVLMMASKFRYVDDIATARALIRAGILGTVVHYENTFASWLDVTQRWNADPKVAGGGVLIDNGSHSVDIVRYLLGPLHEVLAYHGPRVQPIEVEDTSHITFRTGSGVVGTIDLSWSIQKERESYIEVFGTEGMLAIGWRTSRYRQTRAASWVTFGKGYDKLQAFTAQLRNFVGACRGREAPLITGEDALASVLAIEAGYASARTGSWQTVAAV